MATATGDKRLAWFASNGLWPGAPTDPHQLPGGVGPYWIPLDLDFTAAGSNGNPIDGDNTFEEMLGKVGSIQTLFIDNSLNTAQPFSIQFGGTRHKLSVLAKQMAILPIMAPTPLTWRATTTGLVVVTVMFGNMAMFPFVWNAVP